MGEQAGACGAEVEVLALDVHGMLHRLIQPTHARRVMVRSQACACPPSTSHVADDSLGKCVETLVGPERVVSFQ